MYVKQSFLKSSISGCNGLSIPFLEKLSGEKLDVPEVTQSEEGQKQKLGIVLAATNRVSDLLF